MDSSEFRKFGIAAVNTIADYFDTITERYAMFLLFKTSNIYLFYPTAFVVTIFYLLRSSIDICTKRYKKYHHTSIPCDLSLKTSWVKLVKVPPFLVSPLRGTQILRNFHSWVDILQSM